jgi:hypothetical protein
LKLISPYLTRLSGGGDSLIAAAATDIAAHDAGDLGFGRVFAGRQEGRCLHDLAGLAIAALRHLNVRQAFCTGWLPSGSRPSIVTTARPSVSPIAVTQARVAWPSTWTVQAPHSAIPQPNFVPVNPSSSRRYQRSGIDVSSSKLCFGR